MNKKILIILCLILFIVSVAGVSAAEDINQTIIVENTDNLVSTEDTLGVSTEEDVNPGIDDDALSVSEDVNVISEKDNGTFTALQEKIDKAPEGSTINLENDYVYNYDFGTVYGIEISKPLMINGNGHTIDALSNSRIFSIESDNVILKNIKFDNGYSRSPSGKLTKFSGGAIYMEGENCQVINSTFTNNVGRNGGAIYFTGSNFNIINSTFIKNTASPSFQGDEVGTSYYTYYVGGYGGAIYLKGKNCSVINSIFTDNRANITYYESSWGNMVAGGSGGAIYVEGNKNNLSYSIFKNNIAGGLSGGAIYLEGDDSVINYCSYSKEYSYMNGIYISGSNNVINEYSTTIKVEDVTKNYGGPEKLEITLTESGSPIANADVNININGADYTRTTDINGKAYLDLNLNAGNYDATVSYQDVSTVSKVIINQLPTTTTISYNKNSRNSVTLTALVNPTTAGGNVVFTVNGKNYSADKLSDGKATRTLSNLATGNYEAKATYQGDVNHKSSASSSVKFTVDEVNIELKVPDVTKNYGGPEKLEITLTEDGSPIANADVNININGTYYGKTTDSNGKASMDIDLNAGIYDAIVTYQTASKTAKITVNQLSTKTTLDYTTNSQYSVTLTALINPATAGGNVVFTVNGKDYAADKVNNGKATRTLSNLDVGNYEAKATYQGDINHKSSLSNSVKFTVKDVKVDISASDLTKYYHGPERFVVTVKEDNKPVVGKNVTINLNNVPYNRTTDANGQASMAINLNSGTYNVTSEYDGIKVKSTITVKPTIQGKDITKIYKNGTQYYATFVDTNGNLMKNTDITFNINGVFYTRKTNDQGVAKMNINLPPGTYIITAENPNSKEKYTNVIKVLPSIVENYDLTKYYKNASKYTLRIIGDDGKPVGEGVTVKLNINGVFYERKTNATGYMNMNINLPPGTYTVTAEYNGLRASNKITVLSILKTKDLSMKYKDGSKFEAKILDGQGKPYAGQTVTFNINGVFYTKNTEADGIARLSINLLAGEYIITSMYNGLNAANKVTISG